LAQAIKNGSGPVYIQADASSFPVKGGSFDVTLSISTLQYMPIHEVVRNCRQALRPHGHAIFVENLSGNLAAKIDRLRRRLMHVAEPPTMRIRRHLSLSDTCIFQSQFNSVTTRVWYDWSTVLIPLLDAASGQSRRLLERVVSFTAKPIPQSAWRSRFAWIAEISAEA
jgi:SAM-dependent methyltransferase